MLRFGNDVFGLGWEGGWLIRYHVVYVKQSIKLFKYSAVNFFFFCYVNTSSAVIWHSHTNDSACLIKVDLIPCMWTALIWEKRVRKRVRVRLIEPSKSTDEEEHGNFCMATRTVEGNLEVWILLMVQDTRGNVDLVAEKASYASVYLLLSRTFIIIIQHRYDRKWIWDPLYYLGAYYY